MVKTSNHPKAVKKAGPSKLVVGFLAAAMTAFVGLAGVANASPGGGNNQHVGYGGYGTQTNVNANIKTDVNLKVNGDNNVFNIVINYILGTS